MKIHIETRDDIDPEVALTRVAQVVSGGKVSSNNTKYCWLTLFPKDKLYVALRENRKSDCFVVYKDKRK